MKIATLIFMLFFFCAPAAAESMLLRLKVTKIQTTDYCSNCNSTEPDTVVLGVYWHIYTAKVIKVIDGKYTSKKIRFAILQHAAYDLSYVKDVYVVLDRITDKKSEDNLGVMYWTDKISLIHPMVCIPAEAIEKLSDKERYEDSLLPGSDSCFYKEKLDADRDLHE